MGIDNPIHLIFLAAVALLVFGPKRLPELARSLGKGIREFREAVSNGSTGSFLGTPEGDAVSPPAPVPSLPADDDGFAAGAVQDADVVSDGASHGDVIQNTASGDPGGDGSEHSPPAGDDAARQIDPAQPVRSADAPDRRSL